MLLDMTKTDFPFEVEDVVLAEWQENVYYAKILSIDTESRSCLLLFDDESAEDVKFEKIHSG